MASKYLQKYPVPQDFQEILHDFTREIIRDQPDDILLYCCNYFDALNEGRSFSYDSKYNIKKADQKNPKEYSGGVSGYKSNNNSNQHQTGQKPNQAQSKTPASNAYSSSHTASKPVDSGSNKRPSNANPVVPKIGISSNMNGNKRSSRESDGLQRQDSGTSHRTEKSLTKNYVGELYNSALKHVPKDTDESEEQVVLDGPIEEYEKAATFIQKKWKDHKGGDNSKKEKPVKRPRSAEAKKKPEKEEVFLEGPIEEYEKAATKIQSKWKSRQAGKEEGNKKKKGKKDRPLSSDNKAKRVKEEVVLDGPIEEYEKAALKIQQKWKKNQGKGDTKKSKEQEDEESTITRNIIETKGRGSIDGKLHQQKKEEEVILDGPLEDYEKAATTIQSRWKEKKEGKKEKKKDEIKGQLLVNLISAKNLLPDSDEDIETFCMAFISSKPENIMKTDNVETTHNPQWKHKDKVVFGLKKKQFAKTNLIVQVYNLDQGKSLIGEAEIQLKKIFENPGSWINEPHQLTDMEGENKIDSYVYVQACWQPDGMADREVFEPEMLEYL